MTNEARVPGARLRRFAERTLEPVTLDRVVLPALADLQHECREDAGASRLVCLRAYWGLSKTLALCLLMEVGAYGRPMVGGVVTRMTIIVPIVMGIVMVPPALTVGLNGRVPLTQFLLTSLPQAFTFAVPIAFFFAVALDRHATSLRRLVPIVFAMSLVCSLVMLAGTFYAMPLATQAYVRSAEEHLKAAGRPSLVSFGPSEWTFTELVLKARSSTSERNKAAARQAIGMRLAQSTWPIVLGFLALGIAGYERMTSLSLGVWLLMFYVAALRSAAPSSFQGPSVRSVWLVNATFVLAGLCLVWLRPNPLRSDEPKGYVIT